MVFYFCYACTHYDAVTAPHITQCARIYVTIFCPQFQSSMVFYFCYESTHYNMVTAPHITQCARLYVAISCPQFQSSMVFYFCYASGHYDLVTTPHITQFARIYVAILCPYFQSSECMGISWLPYVRAPSHLYPPAMHQYRVNMCVISNRLIRALFTIFKCAVIYTHMKACHCLDNFK